LTEDEIEAIGKGDNWESRTCVQKEAENEERDQLRRCMSLMSKEHRLTQLSHHSLWHIHAQTDQKFWVNSNIPNYSYRKLKGYLQATRD
jgi:tetrahydrodipicolinate N-succinyltransferase